MKFFAYTTGYSALAFAPAAAALVLAAAASAQTDPSQPSANAAGDAIVVTATRSGDAVRADLIGASVTLLDPALLDFRQIRIVSDILRDVPGVAVSRAGGPGGLTQVRIRGSEAKHVLVLIDGIEVSDPFQGAYDFAGLLADDGARIEMLRGQQSSLYGSDAIGGVIQVLTATGRDAPGFSARVEGGSFGTVDAAARAGGVSGNLDYAVTGTYARTDGTPTARGGTRNIGSDGGAASAKLTYAFTPNFKLTAVGRYTRTNADYSNSDQDTASKTYGQIIDSPGVRSVTEAVYGLVRGEASFLEGRWTNALGVQVADSRRDGYDLTGRTSGENGTRVKSSAESTLRFGSERVKHRITVALDVERETFRNRDPSGFAFGGQRNLTDTGIVGSYNVIVDDAASFGASVRRDLNTQFADTTTYRVQASYAFAEGTRLRAAAGSGVKNPLFYDLYGFDSGRYIGNPNLKPEHSDGFEVGAEQKLFGDAATAGVTYFDNRLHDEIYSSFGPAPDFAQIPANRTTLSKQQGVEVFVTSRIGEAWRVDASYTHLHARDDGGEKVRRAPDIASASVTWSAPRQLASLTGTVRYNGRQKDITFTDPSFATTPIVTLASYTLVNIAGEAKLTAELSAFGRVENLLGEKYEEIFSYRAPGRAIYAGVRARF